MAFTDSESENRRQSKTRSNNLQQTPGPIERIEYFGDSDDSKVLLLVGHDDMSDGSRQFLVSESYLRALGPRFKALMSTRSPRKWWLPKWPKWLSRRSPVAINLWDEEVNVVRVMMQVIHHNFKALPLALDWTVIVNLTDFVARYDCHTLLSPYIDGWLRPYKDKLYEVGYEEWLLVAFQFGYEAEYLELAKHLAIYAHANDAGTSILAPSFPFDLKGKFPVDTLGMFASHSSRSFRKNLDRQECRRSTISTQSTTQ